MENTEGIDPEDHKQIRKLRKVLRQVEHLQILSRELNPEEKLKVSKRSVLRQQLIDLNAKYAHLLLDASATFDNSDLQTESSFDFEELNASPRKNASEGVDDITQQLDSLNLSEKKEVKKSPSDKQTADAVQKPVVEAVRQKSPARPKKEEQSKPIKNTLASLIRFSTAESENSHEDLITCLDACSDSMLLTTGSRDTTIKVWNLDNGKLLHSFGGHTSAITCLKFWPIKCYRKCMQNIISTVSEDEPEYEESKQFLEECENIPDNEQLILSSSLDCSFRIWSISEGKCLRQFYLYNCINKFDLNDTAISFALDAGKIEYWNNIVQKCTLKAFDDAESVREIQFSGNLICALTTTGRFKIFMCTNSAEPVLNLLKESQLSNQPNDIRRVFSHFVMINEHQVLLTNGQSCLISQDLLTKESKQIPNNSNEYGMSTCITNVDNFVYSSAYDIDTGASTVNVFSINNDKINYEYTFEDKSNTSNHCISTISAKSCQNKQKYNSIFVTGSYKSFKIWKLWNDETKNTSGQRVRYAKLVQPRTLQLDSHEEETDKEEDDDDDDDGDNNYRKKEDENVRSTSEQKKSNCLVQ